MFFMYIIIHCVQNNLICYTTMFILRVILDKLGRREMLDLMDSRCVCVFLTMVHVHVPLLMCVCDSSPYRVLVVSLELRVTQVVMDCRA